MQWGLFLARADGLGQAPAQQKVSGARDRMHGEQQRHQQIAADVDSSRNHGGANQGLQCGRAQ